MVETASTMLPLGSIAPDFCLPDPRQGCDVSLSDIKSDVATVVMFICNHCPYVIHIMDELFALAHEYQAYGITFVAINANNVTEYPADAPEKMTELAQRHQLKFPYLYDESQTTAKAYHAACTPDFFVFDQNLACVYRGQFDDSRPGNSLPVNGHSLREALNAIRQHQPVSAEQIPSVGCNIKWKG